VKGTILRGKDVKNPRGC